MTAHTCQPTDRLCPRCTNQIARHLQELLTLWTEAHNCLTPGGGGHGTASSELTLGINVVALSFINGADILDILHAWEHLIRDERNLTPPALLPARPLADEIQHAVRFQQTHLDWSACQPWADDWKREISELHALGMTAARQYVTKSRRIPCPADLDDGTTCGNRLTLPDTMTDTIHCRRCSSEWTPIRLVAVSMSSDDNDIWLDLDAIAQWLGISERHARRIANKHHVRRRGTLYDLRAMRDARKQDLSLDSMSA